MTLRPFYGALLVSLLVAGCSAPATPPTDATDRATSPLLSDARLLAEKTWEAVENTTAQAVSLVNQAMTAAHQSVDRLFRH